VLCHCWLVGPLEWHLACKKSFSAVPESLHMRPGLTLSNSWTRNCKLLMVVIVIAAAAARDSSVAQLQLRWIVAYLRGQCWDHLSSLHTPKTGVTPSNSTPYTLTHMLTTRSYTPVRLPMTSQVSASVCQFVQLTSWVGVLHADSNSMPIKQKWCGSDRDNLSKLANQDLTLTIGTETIKPVAVTAHYKCFWWWWWWWTDDEQNCCWNFVSMF